MTRYEKHSLIKESIFILRNPEYPNSMLLLFLLGLRNSWTEVNNRTRQCCEKLFLPSSFLLFAYLPHLNVSDHPTNFHIRLRQCKLTKQSFLNDRFIY